MGAARKDEKYNGWTNYETWAVSLWIDNEESSYKYWREQAAKHKTHIKVRPGKPRYGNSAVDLADHLKDELSEQAPDLGASLSECGSIEHVSIEIDEGEPLEEKL